MESNQNLLTPELHVDGIAFAHLKETAKWAKFLAIVGFFICGILGIVALFSGNILNSMGELGGPTGTQAMLGAGLMSAMYIIIGIIYFALSLFLYRFAGKMNVELQSTDQDNFNLALHNLKLVYRITGIIVIVYLALIVLLLIFGIGAAAFMS